MVTNMHANYVAASVGAASLPWGEQAAASCASLCPCSACCHPSCAAAWAWAAPTGAPQQGWPPSAPSRFRPELAASQMQLPPWVQAALVLLEVLQQLAVLLVLQTALPAAPHRAPAAGSLMWVGAWNGCCFAAANASSLLSAARR